MIKRERNTQPPGGGQAAIERCRRILARNPSDNATRARLGELLRDAGRNDEAEQCFRAAIICDPASAAAHNDLGRLYHETGRIEEATAYYRGALKCDSGCMDALYNLGLILRDQGCYEEALESFRKALERKDDPALRIRLACLLPVIPESTEQIAELRSRMKHDIESLAGEHLTIERPLPQIGMTPFYNSYHGECNRDVYTALGRLYRQACPALTYTAPHCRFSMPRSGRLKVGIISRFLYKHSIGRTTSGLVARLSRDLFEVHVICIPPFIDDPLARSIKENADHVTLLGGTLPEARRQIAELALDILFYQDIGMDPYSYFLAFSRLAPVQCVSFGHPDTTGIPNMDYFISSDLFEPDGADGHYSEELYMLGNAGTLAYYYRPVLTAPAKSRADFDLPGKGAVYLCPQALFKFHPDFDSILCAILQKDPDGVLVLVESAFQEVTGLLRRRLSAFAPEVSSRIIFMPRMGGDDFLHLIAIADVMLDTIHFNGMNTSLEAFSVGTPIVTLPGTLQRSRHTYGMYRRMGITECIAESPESYVSIALELAGDKEKRAEISRRILEKSHLLFEDQHVVDEFQKFFLEAHAKKNAQLPQLRVAVVTPYHREAAEVLESCHRSVLQQTHKCTHIMVADGHPLPAAGNWDIEHIILPQEHGDNGDTPRAIGSMAAIGEGFDAIAYLDADNSYRPDHIESLVRLHLVSASAVCTSGRTIHRQDGSQLPVVEAGDVGQSHVDTSCLFLARPAFHLASLWAAIPAELSPICDRVFWTAVREHKLTCGHSGKDTVLFCSRYAEHYLAAGEEPPAGAKESQVVDSALERWRGMDQKSRRRLSGL